MKLLPNEEKIIVSNEEKIILTNQRIKLTESVLGKSNTICIFLENISSIEIKYKSSLIFAVLGVLNILLGIYMKMQGNSNEIIFILGGAFLAVWWFTRKHVIAISSNGGSSLDFIIQGMDNEKINDFFYSVSLAKQKRVNELAKV